MIINGINFIYIIVNIKRQTANRAKDFQFNLNINAVRFITKPTDRLEQGFSTSGQ